MDEYTVSLVAVTTVRLRDGDEVVLDQLPVSTGQPVTITLMTDYAETPFGVSMPERLRADVVGQAPSLAEAETLFQHLAAALTPVLAFVVNGHVAGFWPELCYASDEDTKDRELVQYFYDLPQPVIPPDGRVLTPGLAQRLVDVLERWLRHPDSSRIHRAMTQYQEALSNWKPGEDLAVVSHLWMGFEAITKAALRAQCARASVTEDELCAAWNIERKKLDSEVRIRLLFHGDSACYKNTKEASDGLEHGYVDFPRLHQLAINVRECAARHLRQSIAELLELDEAAQTELLDIAPLDLSPFFRRVSARLVGEATHLAAEGERHPRLRAQPSQLVGIAQVGDHYQVTSTFTANPAMAEGLEMTLVAIATTRPIDDLAVDVNGQKLETHPPDL